MTARNYDVVLSFPGSPNAVGTFHVELLFTYIPILKFDTRCHR
jgi:hypothetical protein